VRTGLAVEVGLSAAADAAAANRRARVVTEESPWGASGEVDKYDTAALGEAQGGRGS